MVHQSPANASSKLRKRKIYIILYFVVILSIFLFIFVANTRVREKETKYTNRSEDASSSSSSFFFATVWIFLYRSLKEDKSCRSKIGAYMHTIKVHIGLCICTVWSVYLHFTCRTTSVTFHVNHLRRSFTWNIKPYLQQKKKKKKKKNK